MPGRRNSHPRDRSAPAPLAHPASGSTERRVTRCGAQLEIAARTDRPVLRLPTERHRGSRSRTNGGSACGYQMGSLRSRTLRAPLNGSTCGRRGCIFMHHSLGLRTRFCRGQALSGSLWRWQAHPRRFRGSALCRISQAVSAETLPCRREVDPVTRAFKQSRRAAGRGGVMHGGPLASARPFR